MKLKKLKSKDKKRVAEMLFISINYLYQSFADGALVLSETERKYLFNTVLLIQDIHLRLITECKKNETKVPSTQNPGAKPEENAGFSTSQP